jgi:hypothetical protein
MMKMMTQWSHAGVTKSMMTTKEEEEDAPKAILYGYFLS